MNTLMNRELRLLRGGFLLLLLLLLAIPAYAERKYTVGADVGVFGGGSNQVGGVSLDQVKTGMMPYFAAVPTLNLSSEGRNSLLNLGYTFAAERYVTDHNLDSTFHMFTADFNSRVSKRVTLKLWDSLDTAPQFRIVGYGGTAFTAEGFRYLYDPILAQRGSFSNYARGRVDVDVTPKSFLTFGGSHSFRTYEKIAEQYGGLYDRNRAEGNAAWSRRTSEHQSIGLKYSILENRVESYAPVRTQSATVILTREPGPTWKLSLEAGPSYSTSRDFDATMGYVIEASVSKSFHENRFSLYYFHRPAENIGIGSISETDNAGMGFDRTFKRKWHLRLDTSAYDSRAKLENSLDSRGFMGHGMLGFVLNEHWSFGFGGSYQSQRLASYDNLSYERVYGFVHFSMPRMVRGTL
jgi:hypothetical protein